MDNPFMLFLFILQQRAVITTKFLDYEINVVLIKCGYLSLAFLFTLIRTQHIP